ncbi:MAG: YggS family pyridoxal phosphate-dependent enzyme [Candidatus Omnitrophica bacterium]|nr:YggS family pyridoxal phosphate-dependent enzyme [Candidatus Omnitrophota bacterium]
MIKENILQIKEIIQNLCLKAACDGATLTMVAISKGRSIEEILEAISAGITDIGENRVQEAVTKYNRIRNTPDARRIKWHMVGHLQGNKIKDAVRIFDLIQSVDSVSLAAGIDKEAARINKVQDILLEVKVSGEDTKFGFKPGQAVQAIREISRLCNVKIRGLMTIAPAVNNPEDARPYFRQLKELSNNIIDNPILSMGMSDDFGIAIEEGSNMVRLGRAIFEG